MFLDIIEPKIENKKASLDKTVLVMWSQIFERVAQFGLKCTLKKVCKSKTVTLGKASKKNPLNL